MEIFEFTTWSDFCSRGLTQFVSSGLSTTGQHIFRGQADADWPLCTTLERFASEVGRSDLQPLNDELITNFQRQANGLPFAVGRPSRPSQWELLARHHELPSRVLDWTFSPMIAAFFAFLAPKEPNSGKVAIWHIDRAAFTDVDLFPSDDVLICDDPEDMHLNTRAAEQMAVCLSLRITSEEFVARLGSKLRVFKIPHGEREMALRYLQMHGVCSRNLFRDLNGAAATAAMMTGRGGNNE